MGQHLMRALQSATCGFEKVDVADVRDERIIAQLAAITQRTRHRVYEPLESLARERRDFDRFANRFAIDLPRGGKIRLVRGDDAGARRLRGDERAIVVRQPTRAIEDDTPPPIAPADIICISMTPGNTSATPASASVPSLPMK